MKPSMVTMFEMVREFHRDFGHPSPSKPTFLTHERLTIRRKWQEEEREEFNKAYHVNDMVGCADAIADEIYFLLGMAVEMGLPMDHIVYAVHKSNMSKANFQGPHAEDCQALSGKRCTCGKITYNELGKTLKPAHWQPPEPEIERCLEVYR